ncbi:MAG: SUMF1/EgtB/PvdO family nonheme iron enzyme [Bryobacterales bacterium]|nr:SUMF1/EgtB/PvdO family nonheme iron enzyme [Bryobacterales bacterium]
MQHHLRQRLKRLLMDLPQWDDVGPRTVILRDTIGAHAVFESVNVHGGRAESAEGFLSLLEPHPDALCLFLRGLRVHCQAHPGNLAEVNALLAELCSGRVRRRRERWRGAPYKGLTYFDKDDAPLFFGREKETQELIQKLAANPANRFTVIIGNSGSGKSSLMRAGLWAALADGDVPEFPGSRHWLITAVKPNFPRVTFLDSVHTALVEAIPRHDAIAAAGLNWRAALEAIDSTPLHVIADELLGPVPDARWLLLLDQMEELFAPEARDACERFLGRLLEATRPPPAGTANRFQVVATLREDFLGSCLQHPALREAMNNPGGAFFLGQPDRPAMERMVSGPLTELELEEAWTLDPALPGVIAADAAGQTGGLALMAFALRELYDRCKPARRMDLSVYESDDFGGLGKAIARSAGRVLASLGEGAGETLHRVFRHLVRVTADLAPIRRREPLATWNGDPEAQRFIDALVAARLLVTGQSDTPIVEVAHEALLREWPTLAAWIDSQRDVLRLRDRVIEEARVWDGSELQRQHRRTWHGDEIDRCRRRLGDAGLLDALLKDPDIARFLTPEAEWLLEEIEQEGTKPLRRWEIGRRLSAIGDPRPGVGLRNGVPDILWRPIPVGEVEMAGHGSFTVEPFSIAAYPVTVTQFRAFVRAEGGYRADKWWHDLQRKTPRDSWLSDPGSDPITRVSWYDATAFCRWLSEALGVDVRLPFEWEWQWAAQSAQRDFLYPWGPEWLEGFANTYESAINHATAVGVFPRGNSLQEVSDLAGNVWEWCANRVDHPRDPDIRNQDARVLRGGSWSVDLESACAEYRNGFHPVDRLDGIGFRVVCSSPSTGH